MLQRLLEENGEAIARKWVELVLATYPGEARGFLHNEGDPFANPVGRTVREAAPLLVEALAADELGREASQRLRELMRIRSVQDLTASEAVGVVPLLRRAVLDIAGPEVEAGGPGAAAELAERTERLLLAAFEAFTESRERLYEARLHERDRHRASLMARAERVLKEMEGSSGPEGGRMVES
ncbi:MAG TPA: hypothetical protein ENK19_00640 [Acidobacteria bacterium]|nr:hypothetical protein [Acidobacteriota bacterium]